MTHPTSQALREWIEDGRAADRGALLAHLAECDACRTSLAGIAREAEAGPGPALVLPSDVQGLGYAVRRAPRRSWWPAVGRLRPAWALTAVLIGAGTGVVLMQRGAPKPHDDLEIRGSELLPVSPTSEARGTFEFRWSSPVDAARYRLTVADAAGAMLLDLVVPGSSVTAPADFVSRLIPGARYTWRVEALDEGSTPIAASRGSTFTFR